MLMAPANVMTRGDQVEQQLSRDEQLGRKLLYRSARWVSQQMLGDPRDFIGLKVPFA